MKSFTLLNSTLLLFALTFTTLLSAQKIKPAIKVTADQKFEYSTTMNLINTQSMSGQEYSTEMDITASTDYVVDSVWTSGEPVMVVSTHDMKVKTSMMGKDTVITSPGLVGSSSRIVYNLNGKDIFKSVIENKDASKNPVPGLDNSGMYGGIFIQFPDTAISENDKWTIERSDTVSGGFSGEMVVKSSTINLYAGKVINEGVECYQINYISDIEITGKGNTQGMEVYIEGTGVNEGTTFVIISNGVIHRSESNSEMNLSVAIAGQQSMTIPMQQKMKISQILKK
jgi:hypothetical protein